MQRPKHSFLATTINMCPRLSIHEVDTDLFQLYSVTVTVKCNATHASHYRCYKIYKHIALLYCGTARIDKTHSDCFIRVFQLFTATNQ